MLSGKIYSQHKDSLTFKVDTSLYHPELKEYFFKSGVIIPISEIVGINCGLGAFNRYITNEPFARISFSSIGENFKQGFSWDNDIFTVNQFAHPYHGNLYFNSARSNGYSFVESIPFTFGGSLMWEFFMETDPPQTNDLINTTLGGVMLGEITYKLSSLLFDESKTGFERISREILGSIINPVRGFNRLLRGDMKRKTPKNVNEVFPVSGRFSLGYSGINPNKKVSYEKDNLLAEINLIYQKNLRSKEFKPFEVFRLKIGMDSQSGDIPSSWVDVYGLLYGRNLLSIKDKVLILGLFQDFDYYYNSVYNLGSQSAGLGLILNIPVNNFINISGNFHNNFIILSALNSINREGEYRDYDFLIGNKILTEGILEVGPVSLQLEYKFYYMKSIDGIPGEHTLGVFNPKIFVRVFGNAGAGAEYLFFHRHSVYKKIEVNNLNLTEQRIYFSYLF